TRSSERPDRLLADARHQSQIIYEPQVPPARSRPRWPMAKRGKYLAYAYRFPHGDLFPSPEVSAVPTLHKPAAPVGGVPRLLEVARERMRTRHLSLRTEQAYLQWTRRYVAFHEGRHPRELGAPAVEQFLTPLAVHLKVSSATQNQALQALLFLYRQVLEIELPWLDNITR